MHVECKKSDTSNNRVSWYHQNHSENTKARYREIKIVGTAENSHGGHCTHT